MLAEATSARRCDIDRYGSDGREGYVLVWSHRRAGCGKPAAWQGSYWGCHAGWSWGRAGDCGSARLAAHMSLPRAGSLLSSWHAQSPSHEVSP